MLACTVGFHTDDDDGDSARLFLVPSVPLLDLLVSLFQLFLFPLMGCKKTNFQELSPV